jgi:outer membrane protein OmpA-like peptidoglycan-associated protein
VINVLLTTTTPITTAGLLVALGLSLCLGLVGCAAPPHQSIVLVPDPAGHVGAAEVRTAVGAQMLQKSGDMTRTKGASAAPSTPTTAETAFINTTFGEALAVEPPPAQTFTLLFENGSAVLRADSLGQLDEIAAASHRRMAVRVSISGHTDAVGSDKLNDGLARARTEEVKQQLLRRRVSPELILTSSHGKGNPLIPTPDGVAEPRNRRVVVIVR